MRQELNNLILNHRPQLAGECATLGQHALTIISQNAQQVVIGSGYRRLEQRCLKDHRIDGSAEFDRTPKKTINLCDVGVAAVTECHNLRANTFLSDFAKRAHNYREPELDEVSVEVRVLIVRCRPSRVAAPDQFARLLTA
jgi:hypothetical protein